MRKKYIGIGMVVLLTLAVTAVGGKLPAFRVNWLGKPPGFKGKIVIMHFLGNPLSGTKRERDRLERKNVPVINLLHDLREEMGDNGDVVIVGYTGARPKAIKTWAEANGVNYPLGCGLPNLHAMKMAGVNGYPTVNVYDHNCIQLFSGVPSQRDKRFKDTLQKGLDRLFAAR
ncbi:hypothetical protein ACFL54_08865, partial [Planctomycetota bacterium]